MKVVAITGAYGYLGSVIRREFNDRGWRTVGLVRAPQRGDDAVRWTLGDAAPGEVLSEANALVHCAYDFEVRGQEAIRRVNVDGSAALLQGAKPLGVQRILVLSSMSAYEGTRQLYGRAKLQVEEVGLSVDGICVRPGLVYGPSPGGMVGALTKITRLPVVPVLGPHAHQFPVHEQDLTRVIADLVERPDWHSEVIGVAQPEPVEFVELLRALSPKQGRRRWFLHIPWRLVYGTLSAAEKIGVNLPFRADSVLGLVRPAEAVPRSAALPDLLDGLRRLQATGVVGSG